MTGKEKCRILKEIRNKIAKANGIDFVSSECTFDGECRGYCPKCDSEVHSLEEKLQDLAHKGIQIKLDCLNDVSVFDDNDNEADDAPLDGEIDFFDDVLMGKFVDKTSSSNTEDKIFMEFLKEYVNFPSENDDEKEINGLLGDIIPDDIGDAW